MGAVCELTGFDMKMRCWSYNRVRLGLRLFGSVFVLAGVGGRMG